MLDDAAFIRVAKALADPTRRRMVDALREEPGGLTCSAMHERFTLSQPTISHHVGTLERAGLVRIAKEGPYHRLTLDRAALRAFARAVAGTGGPAARRSGRRSGPSAKKS